MAPDRRERIFREQGRFLGSRGSLGECEWILMGAPLDGTASFLPGARFGPLKVREVSEALETYSPRLDRDLAEIDFYDAGDVDLPFGNVSACLEAIEAAARLVVQAGKRPLVLGGEHLVSLPVVRAVHAFHPELAVLQFDAHADLREDYLGEADSHATVMRRITEVVGPERVYQFGIRSGTREEFAFGRSFTRFFPGRVVEALESVLPELLGRPLYVTVDVDVVDPAFAPATGTPEAGGVPPHELFEALYRLSGHDVVAMDVVELCPPAEGGVVTALLVAKLVREALLSFAGKEVAA